MCGMHILHIHVYQCGGTHGCIYKLFYFFPVPVIITMTHCNLGGKKIYFSLYFQGAIHQEESQNRN